MKRAKADEDDNFVYELPEQQRQRRTVRPRRGCADREGAISELVRAMRDAKGDVVFFTGAGISKAAGIPTYRGDEGVYTLKAAGLQIPQFPDLSKLAPTAAHRAIADLISRGVARGVITTNVDGLHRGSGVIEIHGSRFWEVCDNCENRVVRDYDVVRRAAGADERVSALMGSKGSKNIPTGNACEKCGVGRMMTGVVHPNAEVPNDKFDAATAMARGAQLAIVCGASFASDFVVRAASLATKIAILNTEPTDMAKRRRVAFVICDDVQKTVPELSTLV
jgi:mono-ADP-ribosyltransferase sirtuin 6